MARWCVCLMLLVGGAALACSPEVHIAHNAPDASGAGGGGGSAPTAGSSVGAVAGMGEGGAAEQPEPPRLLADSVADFSFEQGKLGWSYGYDGGSLDTFALMTRKAVVVLYVPATKDVWDCWTTEQKRWTQLFRLGAHANGTNTSSPSEAVLQRAVRRWVSNYAGDVVISGEMAKIDLAADPSNGVDCSIYVDGTLLLTRFVGPQDAGGWSYEVPATLRVGSTVDFVLDPHEGDDHHDLTRFTAVIARADESATP